MMKINKWTLGLAALGLVSIPSALHAEEKLSPLQTALSSTVISGYINTSMHWNPGTDNSKPPTYSFNGLSKQDGFNLNVVDITIEKPLDEGTWSAGYKVELWIGPDASTNFNSVAGDLALKQAYVALRVPVGNGLDLKVGTFDTIIGYEVANAGSNPNYSRSYGYTMEPTQHNGILGSYQVNKTIGLTAGVANTTDSGLSTRAGKAESFKSYMGAITLTAPDSFGFAAGSSLSFGTVTGEESNAGKVGTSYYIGGTFNTPVKGLKVGTSYDYHHGYSLSAIEYTQEEAFALYVSYQASEKLTLHARGEYARYNPNNGVADQDNQFLAITGTVQYNLWANVISRLEIRWDHSTAGIQGQTHPYNDSNKNAFLVAANIIYKF